jgi:hypothetical protein
MLWSETVPLLADSKLLLLRLLMDLNEIDSFSVASRAASLVSSLPGAAPGPGLGGGDGSCDCSEAASQPPPAAAQSRASKLVRGWDAEEAETAGLFLGTKMLPLVCSSCHPVKSSLQPVTLIRAWRCRHCAHVLPSHPSLRRCNLHNAGALLEKSWWPFLAEAGKLPRYQS